MVNWFQINHNTINSRECLSLPKNEINLGDSNNNDDAISHDNTISHDDTCALKEDVYSYQLKSIKGFQNVEDPFLKKLCDIEQNLERNFKKKIIWWWIWETSKSTEKENLFLKDEIRRKDKVINILLDNFSNRVPEHSNYITSKITEVSTQTENQTKNNIQISTAGNNPRTIIASEKKMIKTTRSSTLIS